MVNIREITIDWNVSNSVGGTSVLYFDGVGDPGIQVGALNDWFTAVRDQFPASTTFRPANEGRELEDSTGTLIGAWSTTVGVINSGNGGGGSAPNSSQGLLRFTTTAIVNGRFLKGRMFVPGLAAFTNNAGELDSATANILGSNWQTLVAGPAEQVVWSRPFAGQTNPTVIPARPGSSSAVTGTSVWNEFAVQRNRR